jgi:hypothetical protein
MIPEIPIQAARRAIGTLTRGGNLIVLACEECRQPPKPDARLVTLNAVHRKWVPALASIACSAA